MGVLTDQLQAPLAVKHDGGSVGQCGIIRALGGAGVGDGDFSRGRIDGGAAGGPTNVLPQTDRQTDRHQKWQETHIGLCE